MSLTATALNKPSPTDRWLDKPVFNWWPQLTVERLLVVIIIFLTVISRFYDVDVRTMAHDEINHVVPAFTFENYVYDPMTHGPFQFHALAFSYFLFGPSDFSARFPAVIFGIGTVLFALFAWRRYLGRIGAILAGFFFLISPYILFYSRYTRNEIFIVFWATTMLWLVLRYKESGEARWLYWLTFIHAMHYSDKATSYIFTAEILIFLALLFIWEILQKPWQNPRARDNFLFSLLVFFLALLLVAGFGILAKSLTPAIPADPNTLAPAPPKSFFAGKIPMLIAVLITATGFISALIQIIKGLGWKEIRASRTFDLVVLQLLLVLPLLAALPLKIIGLDPLDYSSAGILRTTITFVIMSLLTFFFGLLWNKKVWLRSAAIFWAVFILFYTTLFTHGEGFFKGLVAALGYWMVQQGEVRGGQPLYYYLMQVPLYEFLPAFGVLLATVVAFKHRLFRNLTGQPYATAHLPKVLPPVEEISESETLLETSDTDAEAELPVFIDPENLIPAKTDSADISIEEAQPEQMVPSDPDEPPAQATAWYERWFTHPKQTQTPSCSLPTVALLIYWSLMSLTSFSIAGERMPWLTTHITIGMILTAGWAVGYLLDTMDWELFKEKRGLWVLIASFVLILSLSSLFGSLLGDNPPLQGKTLPQLQATSTFLMSLFGVIASMAALVHWLRDWPFRTFLKLAMISFVALLSVLTARAAWRAAYVNFDNAKEFLVYAHSTDGMKDVLRQVDTISKRLYGDKSIKFAFDDDVRYPFWWYGRDYPNRYDFDKTITKSLRDYPIILVGAKHWAQLESVVADKYYAYTYKRMWWPMQDYFNQTPKSIWEALKKPEMRAALWDIWYNRDYTKYAAVSGNQGLTLATWSPADDMRMYIQKDVAAQIWELGLAPEPEKPKVDPYLHNSISLDPVKVINKVGESTLNAPRGLATAADGSLFVADSRNNRILHLDPEGNLLNAWGTYANILDGPIADGTFNEPWGVAVGPDGLVYVADTWNHRIQVFQADGTFVRSWTTFTSNIGPDGFWGPRGIAVSNKGEVFVTDTGKQRVVVFDAMGNYLTEFGSRGLASGQLDEPVGIVVDAEGKVYVADTWNNRVQIFQLNEQGVYQTSAIFEVDAWTSQSLDDKPFLAFNSEEQLFLTDPQLGRVIRFDKEGTFLQLWGGYENNYLLGVLSGITVGKDDSIWVADASNHSLLQFSPPAVP